MQLGLSMIVKNEEKNLKKNLKNFYHAFDHVVVVDTGSQDGTISFLNDLGVEVIQRKLIHSDKRLIEARNFSIQENPWEWVMVLDADEYISEEDICKIKEIQPKAGIGGYFVKWLDHRYSYDFEDYKMCIINKTRAQFLFNVHACPQVYLRDNEGIGERLNGITLHHYPEFREHRIKYVQQLENGIRENPGCIRFYRFLGYTYFKQGDIEKAKQYFHIVLQHKSKRFPVETMNTYMVLSEIMQIEGDFISTFQLIEDGLAFYEEVKRDFEIKINFRLSSRFLQSRETLLQNHLSDIVAYEFAF